MSRLSRQRLEQQQQKAAMAAKQNLQLQAAANGGGHRIDDEKVRFDFKR